MSDKQKVSFGFWLGVALLFCGAALGGFCIAQHRWVQVAINFGVTVPFSIWGLSSNRESQLLQGQIDLLKELKP